MAFTLETTVGELLTTPAAKSVLEHYAPGMSSNPMLQLLKGMTLRDALALPQAKQLGITEEKVKTILAEINRLVE